jgi:hypothetical protein
MRFNKKHRLIFLDPNAQEMDVDKDEIVDVILSPSIYWVKKVSLPIDNIREVKKLLPTLFEDIVPEGLYSYSAYKSDNDSEYFIFAYEDKKILELLQKQGIAISNVSSIHFAQSEFSNITNAMKINEMQSVYIKDEIVVLVPCCWIEEKGELDLANITLSKHKIALQQFGHIVEPKNFYGIVSVLAVLILLLFVEFLSVSSKANDVLEKKSGVFASYNLKPTMFENRAILQKYEKIYHVQMQFREYLYNILSLKLKKSEKMILLSFKNNVIKVSFSGVEKNKVEHITEALKTHGMEISQSYKNTTLHLEIKL